MKTRNGFVSNSSTSSFVVLGFYVDASKYTDQQLVDTLDCTWKGKNPDLVVYDDKYFGPEKNTAPVPEGKYLVGVEMTDIDEDGTLTMPLMGLMQRVSMVQEMLGLDPQEYPLVLLHHLSGM